MLTLASNRDIEAYDQIVGDTCGPRVLVGMSAFNRYGLLTTVLAQLECATNIKEVNGIETFVVRWFYTEDADNFEDTNPSRINANIRIPTVERAIVEYIKYLEYFYEGYLIEGLIDYLNRFNNLKELYACAERYRVSKYTIDYWLEEARTEPTE